MSKRIELNVNLTELRLLEAALATFHFGDLSKEDQKAHRRLDEMIMEQIAYLEEYEQNSRMYREDEDGYEVLTDEGREVLRENEAMLRSGK